MTQKVEHIKKEKVRSSIQFSAFLVNLDCDVVSFINRFMDVYFSLLRVEIIIKSYFYGWRDARYCVIRKSVASFK